MKNSKNNLSENTNEINSTNQDLLIIKSDKKNLSKLQKSFNHYIEKINDFRQQINAIDAQAEYIRKKIEKDIKPIQTELVSKKREFIMGLANGYKNFKLNRQEIHEVESLICGECLNLINEFGQKDLIETYNQFNEKTYEEEMESEKEMMKQTAQMFYSSQYNNQEDQPKFTEMSDEDFLRFIHEHEQKVEQEVKEEKEKRKEKFGAREKTQAQIEKIAKKQAEEELTIKSMRSIYLDLVKELHPDKEPDAEKRKQKTEIMKRLTVAYDDKNLYELLRLQIEYKQIQENGLSEIVEERLAVYVKVLQRQVAALKVELRRKINEYPNDLVRDLGLGGSVQQITYRVTKHKKELKTTIEQLIYTNKDLTSAKPFKKFLKNSMQYNNVGSDMTKILLDFMKFFASVNDKKGR
ncbi:MAG: J domain-containing protein [Bacteroidetes bacterium]|nr:MAG: J domain-containing protein [Bacteroidota bacterium]TAG86000.1 MAG: J domain-containing protein [Bacteroidota bacterium]